MKARGKEFHRSSEREKPRRARFETLEDRALLSTTPTVDASLCERYSDLDWPPDMSGVNAIELTAPTAEALQAAIDEAAATSAPDVVLFDAERLGTSELALDGTTITIDFDARTSGNLTFASVGSARFRVVANATGLSFDVRSGDVRFAGVDFTGIADVGAFYRTSQSSALDAPSTTWLASDVDYFDTIGVDVGASCDLDRQIANNLQTIDDYFATVDATVSLESNAATSVVDENYAVIFSGGANAANNGTHYYANVVELYATLTTELSVEPQNIYILYADGDATNTSFNRRVADGVYATSDMSFATDYGTSVSSATATELTSVFATVAAKATDSSRVLFYTFDHGSGADADVNDYADYLCGYGKTNAEILIDAATVRDAVYQVKKGFVTMAFAQCFSGGILDDFFNPSTGAQIKSYTNAKGVATTYAGTANFYGMAATNHYESSWTSVGTGRFAGFAQAFVAGLRLNDASKVFEYAKANDPFAADETYGDNAGVSTQYVEHPWDAGTSFPIFSYAIEPTILTTASGSALADAIASTPDGGRIVFDPSLNGQTITTTSPFLLDKNIVFDAGACVAGVQFDGGGTTRLFTIKKSAASESIDVVFRNVDFTGGNGVAAGQKSGNGGVLMIYPGANVSIYDGDFDNFNVEGYGGAILNGGKLTLASCSFTGGQWVDETKKSLYNVVDAKVGGAIFNAGSGTVSIRASGFQYCDASEGDGGAISNNNVGTATSLELLGATFYACAAATNGGAVSNFGAATVGVWANASCVFRKNVAYLATGGGGAFSNGANATATIDYAVFENNSAPNGFGGAIGNAGSLTVKGSDFGRTPDAGGASYGNSAGKNGGAISSTSGATLIIAQSACRSTSTVGEPTTFVGNQATGYGGAIANWGTFQITAPATEISITGNEAYRGGGVSTSVALDDATKAILAAQTGNTLTSSTRGGADFYDYSTPNRVVAASDAAIRFDVPDRTSRVLAAVAGSAEFVDVDEATTARELGANVGENDVLLKFVDENGVESDVVAVKLIVVDVSPIPTLSANVVEIRSGLVRVELTSSVPIAEWSLDWGDGATSVSTELTSRVVFARRYDDAAQNCVLAVSAKSANADEFGDAWEIALFRPSSDADDAAAETLASSAVAAEFDKIASNAAVASRRADARAQVFAALGRRRNEVAETSAPTPTENRGDFDSDAVLDEFDVAFDELVAPNAKKAPRFNADVLDGPVFADEEEDRR